MEEMDSKDYFAGFFHHPVLTMSVLMYAYCYSLFKVEQKQVCEPLL